MVLTQRKEATLKSKVFFDGIGVHSGAPVHMAIHPSKKGTGIVFKRTDVISGDPLIKLSPDAVFDAMLCTKISNSSSVSVAVVEHLLAAFRLSGITNAVVEINAQEIPIMDGSAVVFIEQFKKAGVIEQDAFVKTIVIKDEISVYSKNGSITISPGNSKKISMKLSYDRIDPVIAHNNIYSFDMDEGNFNIASARTFGWIEDYEQIIAKGLARGASEENTVIIARDNSIQNKSGLRHPKEIIMHKCLDLIGDLSILGHDIIGHIECINTSHDLNTRLVKKLYSEINTHDILDAFDSKSCGNFFNIAGALY